MPRSSTTIEVLLRTSPSMTLLGASWKLKDSYCGPFRSIDAFLAAVVSFVPIFDWLPKYDVRTNLAGDIIGGLTTGVMHVPQGIAYSVLVGVDPVFGLYSSCFPAFFSTCFFGTSRHASIGDGSECGFIPKMGQLLKNSAISPIQVAATLTFALGIWQFLCGVLRLQFLMAYFSDPLVSGFTTGAAVHVLLAQFDDMLGVIVPKISGPGYVFRRLYDLAIRLPIVNLQTIAISVCSLTFLIVGKEILSPWLARKCNLRFPVPYELILVIITTSLSYVFNWHDANDVIIVGNIPAGLPLPQLPMWSILKDCLVQSLGIAVVTIAIHISMAKMLAKKHGYTVDDNQELYALGMTGILSGLFPVYPISTALGRTMVNVNSGSKTLLSTVFSSGLLLAIILWIGPLLRDLPKCVLASIITAALYSMFKKYDELKTLYTISKIDFRDARRVSRCESGAPKHRVSPHYPFDNNSDDLDSLIFLNGLYQRDGRSQWPRWSYFTKRGDNVADVEFGGVDRDADRYADLCVFRFDGPLLFTNVERFKKSLKAVFSDWEAKFASNKANVPKFFIIDCTPIAYSDYMGINALKDMTKELQERNVNVYIAGANDSIQRKMSSSNFNKILKEDRLFSTVQEAVSIARRNGSAAQMLSTAKRIQLQRMSSQASNSTNSPMHSPQPPPRTPDSIYRIERKFKFKVFNAQYNGYILSFSADSTWIWVGERDVNSLGLAHFPLFSMLFDADNAQREFHKAATLRLAKQLAVTQINLLRMLRLCPSFVRSSAGRFSITGNSKMSSEHKDPSKTKKTKEEIVKEKTPIGKLDDKDIPYSDPHLPRHPGGVNPNTGERGGPAGPEPTRYDFTRKPSEMSTETELLVEKALMAPNVINFSPYFAEPQIQELEKSNSNLFKTLQVFSMGALEDMPSDIILNPLALKKLRQLSIISYAAESNRLSYDDLLIRLRMSGVRELEDLIIDAIYKEMIKAKLDSQARVVEVSEWMARDASADSLAPTVSALQEWLSNVKAVGMTAERKANEEDEQLENQKASAEEVKNEISNARKNIEMSIRVNDPGLNSRRPRPQRSPVFFSPVIRKGDESLNDSVLDEEILTQSTLLRKLRKAHDFALSSLTAHSAVLNQFQKPLIEIVSLYERAEESAECSKSSALLTIGVFCNICANVLAVLQKHKSLQFTMYRIAYGILSKVEEQKENIGVDSWVLNMALESAVELNMTLTTDSIVATWDDPELADKLIDALTLTTGRFQLVKASIFQIARDLADETPLKKSQDPIYYTSLKVLNEETLKLLLWCIKRSEIFQSCKFIDELFSKSLPAAPQADDLLKSPLSVLDVKMFLDSLMSVSFTVTPSGRKFQQEPTICAQLTLTKLQTQCWAALCDAPNRARNPALRLRCSRVVDAVRLTDGGSEDVRVLFETWKRVLQCAPSQDDNVFEAVREIGDVYKEKMNKLLAVGPGYQRVTSSVSFGSGRSVNPIAETLLFPLPCDYDFVDVTEADHIGAIINSAEAFTEEDNVDDEDSDNEKSFLTAPEGRPSDAFSTFVSPMHQATRLSILSMSQFESPMQSPVHVSSKSVVLTPSTNIGTPQKEALKAFNFGTPAQGTPQPAPRNSIFGTPMSALPQSVFGSSQKSVFGTPLKPEEGILTSTPKDGAQPAPRNSIFGTPLSATPQQSFFGGLGPAGATPHPDPSNIFGSAASGTPQQAPTSIFGSAGPAPSSIFGNSQKSLFGATPQNPPGALGATPAPTSIFGSSQKSLFGATAQTPSGVIGAAPARGTPHPDPSSISFSNFQKPHKERSPTMNITSDEDEDEEEDDLHSALLENMEKKATPKLEVVAHPCVDQPPSPRKEAPVQSPTAKAPDSPFLSKEEDDQLADVLLQASTSMLKNIHIKKASPEKVETDEPEKEDSFDFSDFDNKLKSISGSLNTTITNFNQFCKKISPSKKEPEPEPEPKTLSSIDFTPFALSPGSSSANLTLKSTPGPGMMTDYVAPPKPSAAQMREAEIERRTDVLMEMVEDPEAFDKATTAMFSSNPQSSMADVGFFQKNALFRDMPRTGPRSTVPLVMSPLVTSSKKTTSPETPNHDATRCLGCQDDAKQEAALRRLDQLSAEWDREGDS
ncbi:unnamed protein product [Caenorhabditis auriculariae]|uniref:STAS domain-containing protein n=1 Tax=Caenorhabditis auriculariae TaxID=2777116 RepID=A0A8S1H342_9PELO|nr:unnamed protein product [Caenorhabditis auriculariae]